MFKKSTLALLSLSSTLLIGCNAGFENIGNNDNTIDDGENFFGGVDEHWVLELDQDDSDFRLSKFEDASDDDDEAEFSVSGDRQLAASGYTILTVNSTEGDTELNEDDTITIIEVDDYAIYMQHPERRNADIVPLVRQTSTCPSGDASLSWMTIATEDSPEDENSTFFGQLQYNDTSGSQALEIVSQFSIVDIVEVIPAGITYAAENCDDALDDSNNSLTLYLPSNNAFVIRDESSRNQTIIAQESTEIENINEIDAANGYIGFIFDESAASGSRNDTIGAECSTSEEGDGTCTISFISDPESGDQGAELATIDWNEENFDELPDGFVSGNISINQHNTNIACIINTNVLGSGDQLLNCFAPSPRDDENNNNDPDLTNSLFMVLYAN